MMKVYEDFSVVSYELSDLYSKIDHDAEANHAGHELICYVGSSHVLVYQPCDRGLSSHSHLCIDSSVSSCSLPSAHVASVVSIPAILQYAASIVPVVLTLPL